MFCREGFGVDSGLLGGRGGSAVEGKIGVKVGIFGTKVARLLLWCPMPLNKSITWKWFHCLCTQRAFSPSGTVTVGKGSNGRRWSLSYAVLGTVDCSLPSFQCQSALWVW